MAFGLAAYVSRIGFPPTRKAGFQVLVRLSWAGFHPQGSDKRFSTHVMFVVLLFQASWHNQVFRGPRLGQMAATAAFSYACVRQHVQFHLILTLRMRTAENRRPGFLVNLWAVLPFPSAAAGSVPYAIVQIPCVRPYALR